MPQLYKMMPTLKIVGVYDDTHNGQYGAPRCVVYASCSLLNQLRDVADSKRVAAPVIHPVYGSVCLLRGSSTSCACTEESVKTCEGSEYNAREMVLDGDAWEDTHTYTGQGGGSRCHYQTAFLDPIKSIDFQRMAETDIKSLQAQEVIVSKLLSVSLKADVGDTISYVRRVPSASARQTLQSARIMLPWEQLYPSKSADPKDGKEKVSIPSSVAKVLMCGTPVCDNGVVSIDCYGQSLYARVQIGTGKPIPVGTENLVCGGKTGSQCTETRQSHSHGDQHQTAQKQPVSVLHPSAHALSGVSIGMGDEDCVPTASWIGVDTEIVMIQTTDVRAPSQVLQVSRPNCDVQYITSELYTRLGYSHQTLSDLAQLANASISQANTSHCLLLSGPSGCGKSFAAQTLVEVLRECDVTCQYVSGSRLFTTTEGMAENSLYELFESSNQVLVIDDVDALCPSGTAVANSGSGSVPIRRLTAVFLECLQNANCKGGFTVIGITCRLHTMDVAARSAGRFDVHLKMSHPTSSARLGVLYKLTNTKHTLHSAGVSDIEPSVGTNEGTGICPGKGLCASIPLHPEATAYLPEVAQICHGFSMADLQRLCTEAALHAIREQLALTLLRTDTDSETSAVSHVGVVAEVTVDSMSQHAVSEQRTGSDLDVNAICVHKSDIEYALLEVSPSSLVEFKGVMLTEDNNPNHAPDGSNPDKASSASKPGKGLGFDRLRGMRDTIATLRDSVLMPLLHADLCAAMGIPPPAGMLLAGPHGTGKTVLAKAIAYEAKLKVIVINGSELRTRVVGESEKALARIFESAREAAPCMLLFEQIDIVASARSPNDQGSDRLLTTLLTELDGVGGPGSGLTKSADTNRRVFVVGTTTRPEMLDSAINRPGRLDLHFDLALPNAEDRAEILRYYLNSLPGGPDVPDSLVKQIAADNDGFSGADLEAVARETAMDCLRSNIDAESISHVHLRRAIAQMGCPPDRPTQRC